MCFTAVFTYQTQLKIWYILINYQTAFKFVQICSNSTKDNSEISHNQVLKSNLEI